MHALIATTTVDGRELAAQEGFDPSATAAPGARIVNQGTIQSGTGGFVYLVAPYVRNGSDGVIVSPEGEVQIEAGATVYLTDRPDGRRFAVEYTAPSGGEAVNLGQGLRRRRLRAAARRSSSPRAAWCRPTRFASANGVIELVADAELTLAAGSIDRARAAARTRARTPARSTSGPTARRVMEAGARDRRLGRRRRRERRLRRALGRASGSRSPAPSPPARARAGTRGEIVIDPEEIVIDGSARFERRGQACTLGRGSRDRRRRGRAASTSRASPATAAAAAASSSSCARAATSSSSAAR